MSDIVTLTANPALDISVRVQHVSPDRKLRCDRPQCEPGGGGINVARVVHELGGDERVLWLRRARAGRELARLGEDRGICH